MQRSRKDPCSALSCLSFIMMIYSGHSVSLLPMYWSRMRMTLKNSLFRCQQWSLIYIIFSPGMLPIALNLTFRNLSWSHSRNVAILILRMTFISLLHQHRSCQQRDLGLHVHSSGGVEAHVLMTKAVQRFHYIRRLFRRIQTQARLALYKSHLLSIYDLLLPFWSVLTAIQTLTLEGNHGKIIKHLIPETTNCPQCAFRHLQLSLLQLRRERTMFLNIHKFLFDKYPSTPRLRRTDHDRLGVQAQYDGSVDSVLYRSSK